MSNQATIEEGIRLKEFTAVLENEGLDAGLERIEEYFRGYRDHEMFLYSCVNLFAASVTLNVYTPEDKKRYEDEIIRFCEMLYAGNDKAVKAQAASNMYTIYMGRNEVDKAKQMLDIITASVDSHNLDAALTTADYLMKTNQAEDAAKMLEKELHSVLFELQLVLIRLAQAEARGGNTETADKIAEIYEKANELFNLKKYASHKAALEVALINKDSDKCIDVLDKLMGDLSEEWEQDKSPLYFRNRFMDSTEYYKKSIPTFLTLLENKPETAFIRENEKFALFAKKYRGE